MAGLGISILRPCLTGMWAWAVLDPGGHFILGEGGVGEGT